MANDLEKSVMDLIGENPDSPDVYTDANITEIRDLINDAIEEVCMVTGCHRKVWHVPLKDACNFYQLPDSADAFLWAESVWLYNSKRRLEQKAFAGFTDQDYRWLLSTGGPYFYAILSYNKLCIFPAPSGSVDTLEITGAAIPKRYEEDTERIKLRESFQWSVTHRVVSEWWAMRGDARTAMYHWQQYVDKIKLPGMYPETAERKWKWQGRLHG
jgi:hypothetical protein